jgi:hypothetical protein
MIQKRRPPRRLFFDVEAFSNDFFNRKGHKARLRFRYSG